MSNKFDMLWQIVRTKVKKIKDPEKKINNVIDFLFGHKNKHNKDRVENWLRMTAVAYASPEVRASFKAALEFIADHQDEFTSSEDNTMSIGDTTDEYLKMVYNDLKKRKYGFQFKSVPVAHTNFMKELENELTKRNLL